MFELFFNFTIAERVKIQKKFNESYIIAVAPATRVVIIKVNTGLKCLVIVCITFFLFLYKNLFGIYCVFHMVFFYEKKERLVS